MDNRNRLAKLLMEAEAAGVYQPSRDADRFHGSEDQKNIAEHGSFNMSPETYPTDFDTHDYASGFSDMPPIPRGAMPDAEYMKEALTPNDWPSMFEATDGGITAMNQHQKRRLDNLDQMPVGDPTFDGGPGTLGKGWFGGNRPGPWRTGQPSRMDGGGDPGAGSIRRLHER